MSGGDCRLCKGRGSLVEGVRLKGKPGGGCRIVRGYKALYDLYTEFENTRLDKFRKITGNETKPDSFTKFLVERTDFCPHKLSDAQTNYWLETITLLDGEMGMTLPAELGNIPGLFFEALALIRSARAQARKEDEKKK